MDGENNVIVANVSKSVANEESEQRAKYTLRGILANKFPPPYSYADYRAFCLTELSHDNVDFYSEANIYRNEALKRFNKVCNNTNENDDESQQQSYHGSRYLDIEKVKGEGQPGDYSSQQNLVHQQQTLQLDEADKQYLSYILQDICRSYIQTGSPKEINLSQIVRSRLINHIEDGNNLHPDILLPAMNKAFEMMKTESYPRFLRAILSGQYKSQVKEEANMAADIPSASSRNLFHENVEIKLPNMKESELKEAEKKQSKEVINVKINNNEKPKDENKEENNKKEKKEKKEKNGCCCLIQ